MTHQIKKISLFCSLYVIIITMPMNLWFSKPVYFPLTFLEINENEGIYFPDEGLEKGIREQINKPLGDIYPHDVKNIKSLTIKHKWISNLEGIQYFSNLETLNLCYVFYEVQSKTL